MDKENEHKADAETYLYFASADFKRFHSEIYGNNTQKDESKEVIEMDMLSDLFSEFLESIEMEEEYKNWLLLMHGHSDKPEIIEYELDSRGIVVQEIKDEENQVWQLRNNN